MRARRLSKMALARWCALRCSARMVLLVRSRVGKTKLSHGDVVGISDSGRYSAIARILGNTEVDPSGTEEVGFGEVWNIVPLAGRKPNASRRPAAASF